MVERSLVTIEEACEILGVSRPTFAKIRKERGLRVFSVGKRPRFIRTEILALTRPDEEIRLIPSQDARVSLTLLGDQKVSDLEVAPHTFDLQRLHSFDLHGVLTLLSTLIDRANKGHNVTLLVEDTFACNYLRTLGLFLELERIHPDKIRWDRAKMTSDYRDITYPIPLTCLQLKRQEEPVVEKLKELLRQQGFSTTICDYIGWIIGELVDNSITYSLQSGIPASCYVLAQRYRINSNGSECIILGVADLGPGISSSLKKNPKYSNLSDDRALMTAFKPNVSSWADEYKRGKGLTDVLGIAMGNQSLFRVESNSLCFRADFRIPRHEFGSFSSTGLGTRIALGLIDHDFQVKSRKEISNFIDNVLGEL